MIVGFEELVLRCREEASKAHIREAIRCYEGSAYRAAIVTTYMAVCFDLISKLKALAASGDGKAVTLQASLINLQEQLDNGNTQAISGILAFERNLLENFRDDFEFFGTNEYSDLVRLRDDRNRCAQPTFLKSEVPYEPVAELARLHIRNALAIVLIQEPRQGKAALEEIRAIINSKYFPDRKQDAVARLDAAGVGIARDVLVRAIVDDIVFGVATESSDFYNKIPPLIAFDAVIELRRGVALPRAVVDINKLLRDATDAAIEFGAMFVLRNKDVSAAVDLVSQVAVSQWLVKTSFKFVGNAVDRGLDIPWLSDAALVRLKALTAEDFVFIEGPVSDKILQRAAEVYVGARSWTSANELARKCALPFADRFKEEHVEFIFNEGRNGPADLPGSSGLTLFVHALYKESVIGKQKLDELTEKYSYEMYRP